MLVCVCGSCVTRCVMMYDGWVISVFEAEQGSEVGLYAVILCVWPV